MKSQQPPATVLKFFEVFAQSDTKEVVLPRTGMHALRCEPELRRLVADGWHVESAVLEVGDGHTLGYYRVALRKTAEAAPEPPAVTRRPPFSPRAAESRADSRAKHRSDGDRATNHATDHA